MQYKLIRSKRKTISISFDDDVNVIVKAPNWISKAQINSFVSEKEDWIIATRVRLINAKRSELKERLQLINGDELPFLDGKLMLTVIREGRKTGKVKQIQNRLLMWVPYDADYELKRSLVEKWYRKQAAELISQKTYQFANQLGVQYKDISIKDQKSRWGSCSSKGNLNFNFRIMMAPEKVCDYVIWHELCHLVHMNHSEAFWKLVSSNCSNYKISRQWLKENVKKLYPI